MYRVHLLDKERNLVAVLDQVASWRYLRRASEATPFFVAIPRHWVDEMVPRESALWAFLHPGFYAQRERWQQPESEQPNKGAHAQIASFLQLWKGDRLIVTVRISNRHVRENVIELQCHTEEILLESHVTPAQYSRVIDGLDIGDLARMMLQGWYTVRVKAKAQWDAAIEKVNVDTGTEPGLVLLAKDGEGRYHEQGHIVLRFRKSNIPDFAQWDRIRWLSDNGDPVRTTMQYRYGPGEMSLTPWSEEFEGALPDTLGVVPAAFAEEILDVRINLYTDDTESPDFEDNPVGQTPAVFAVEVIARTAGRVTEGSIPTNTGVIVRNVEADNTPALKVLQDAVEQAGWEFVVHDGKLYLGEELGEDRSDDFILRAGTNMQIESLGDVDEEMVNILTAYGPGDGINRMQVVLRDEASIAAYGPYPGAKEFPAAADMDDLIQQAQEWLDYHKLPVNAFDVQAVFPSEEEPEYGLGDTIRVVEPQSGLIVDTRIMGEERSFGPDGIKVRLDLGRSAKGIAQAVLEEAGLDEPVTPTGLMPPVGLRAFTARPGVRVLVNPYASSRAEGVEIHGSTTPGFAPSTWTLLARGQETRFYFNHLTRGVRWYFKARSYGGGQYSDWTPEVSAVSGTIGGGDIGERVIQEVNIAFEAITEDLLALDSVARRHLQDGIIDRDALAEELKEELDDAAERLGDAEGRLDQAEGRLDQAEGRLDDAESDLEDAKGRLDTVEGTVSSHSTAIEHLEEQIVLKADQEELDAVEQRVSTAEATLTVHSQEIEARVKQEEFDVLEGRVTTAEGTLAVHASEIEARVKQEDFDVLEGRVETAEGTLQVHAQQIAARVTREVFDLLEERVSEAEAELVVHANEIEARVKQEVFNLLEGRVETAESTLVQHAQDIAARVTQTVFDALAQRVTEAEAEIAVHANEIAQRVTQSVFDVLEGRVTHAESAITQNAQAIQQRVTYQEFEVLEGEVGEVEGRVTQAESTLVQHADQIATKVEQSEFDAAAQRLTHAESQIVQHADQIEMRVAAFEGDQPVRGARLAIALQDGQGYIILDADKVLVPGSVVARLIGAQQVTTEHLAARAVTAEKIRSVDAAIAHIVAGDRTDLDHRGLTTWGLSDEVTRAFISPGFAAKARKLTPLARFGDLTGLPWDGQPLPPGTHGVYATDAYFTVGGSPLASQAYAQQRAQEAKDYTDQHAERKIHRGPTPPSSPVADDLWLDTSQVPNKWWRYDGSDWVSATAADIEGIEDVPGAHDFDRLGGVAAGGSVHIGPAGITVTDGKIEITSSDGRTKFVGDRWEVYDENDVLRVRIGRL